MALDEPREDDERFEAGGFSWVVAAREKSWILGRRGVRIDYRSGALRAGFDITSLDGTRC